MIIKNKLVLLISIILILIVSYINNIDRGNYVEGFKYLLKSPQRNFTKNINFFGIYISKFKYKKESLKNIKINQTNFIIEKFTNPYLIEMGPRGYLEFYKDNLFLISGNGFLMNFSTENELKDEIIFKQIKTNLLELSGSKIEKHTNFVSGILIKKDKIYVSIKKIDEKKCYTNSVLVSDLNYKKIFFKELFVNNFCHQSSDSASGGYISDYKKDKILLSIGDWGLNEKNETLNKNNNSQNKNNLLGKIVSLDVNKGTSKIISKGHRNPQGLFYDKLNETIYSAEHGPQGGDEINLDINPGLDVKNYGWPISSYGEHYGYPDIDMEIYDIAPLNKSHEKFGFIEPLKYFTPSIAPTAIIKIEKLIYSKKKNVIYLSSLGWFDDGKEPKNIYDNKTGKNSIHEIILNKNLKIETHNILPLGERIRDLVYIKKINKIAIYLESTGSLVFLETEYN
tara:strand:+ start:66 stop:1424 length:1359 start_codon:yes stop_codon:yes gene_type:complete